MLGVRSADRVRMMVFGAGLQYLLDEDDWDDGLGWVLSLGHALVSGLQCPCLLKGLTELGQH